MPRIHMATKWCLTPGGAEWKKQQRIFDSKISSSMRESPRKKGGVGWVACNNFLSRFSKWIQTLWLAGDGSPSRRPNQPTAFISSRGEYSDCSPRPQEIKRSSQLQNKRKAFTLDLPPSDRTNTVLKQHQGGVCTPLKHTNTGCLPHFDGK